MGFPLKQFVIDHLADCGVDFLDIGPSNPEKSVDYPDVAQQVGQLVITGACERGILICGSGLGMSMAANKIPGIRAAVCDDIFLARLSRAHNDANILCMGANVVTPARSESIVDTWLQTPFDYGRHVSKNAKVDRLNGNASSLPINYIESLNISWERLSIALSPQRTVFGPVLFGDRLVTGLESAAQAGFKQVELSLRDPAYLSADELDRLLKGARLGLSGIATGQSCLHDELCLCSPSADLCQTTVERLKAHTRTAVRYGATVIIGGVRGRLKGTDREMKEQRERAIEAIRECAAYAHNLGVPIVLECINRYETNLACSVDDGLAILDEVGEPDLKLLLDTFHMNIEEPDVAASLYKAAGHIGYIHFSDSNRQAPGCGHIDFVNVLNTLDLAGYNGPVSTEILPLPCDEEALRRSASYYRALIETSQTMKVHTSLGS